MPTISFQELFNLTPKQLVMLAEILKDIAQILLAGWTIGPAVTNNFKWPFATIGFILSVLSWCGTLLLIKQANSKKKHVRN